MNDFFKEYKYKTELHAHTAPVSVCSEITPKELMETYEKLKFHAVAITNHFEPKMLESNSSQDSIRRYLDDFDEAFRCGKELGIHAILGLEIRFTENINDYLVYGIDAGFAEKAYYYLDKGIEKFYENMKDENCVILQAHPFRRNMVRANPRFIDGVETYNMHPNHNSAVAYAIQYAKEHDFIKVAGSDFHHPGMAGLAALMSKTPVKDSFELASLLKSKEYVFDICGDIVIPY